MAKKEGPAEVRVRIHYIAGTYAEYQRLIQRADAKANIVVVLIGVILSMFFRFFIDDKGILDTQVLFVLIPFIIAGFFAFLTLYPSITRKSGEKSLLYFKDCRERKVEEIATAIMQNSEKEVYRDYARNVIALAEVLNRKFTYLRYAYIFFAIAVICKVVFESIVLL